ncbi:phage tail protein, partial [Enterobacter hormaechei]
DALGNDPNFATTVLNKLAEKLAKNQNGADIPDPALFVKNLGLGEGSALPVGVPIPWPSATPPTGWLKCNGAAFTASQYPKLAQVYPALRLPDLRGEFIRGWDDGRGADSGRELLSVQGDSLQNITATFGDITTGTNAYATGALSSSVLTPNLQQLPSTGNYKQQNYSFDASRVARTSAETRPRNIAFNYIV